MDQMTVPIQLMQALVNYLETKPFKESSGFIAEILKYAPKPELNGKESKADA